MILLDGLSLDSLFGYFGDAFIQAFGGNVFITGIVLMLSIAMFSWYKQFHMTTTYFLCFIALTLLKFYLNDATTGLGAFDLMYNLMLLGLALIFSNLILSGTKR